MTRLLQNAVAVLLVTLLTAGAVFLGVSAFDVPASSANSGSMASTAALTCPSTGCTAVSCHATAGTSPGGHPGGRWRGNTTQPGADSGTTDGDWPQT